MIAINTNKIYASTNGLKKEIKMTQAMTKKNPKDVFIIE